MTVCFTTHASLNDILILRPFVFGLTLFDWFISMYSSFLEGKSFFIYALFMSPTLSVNGLQQIPMERCQPIRQLKDKKKVRNKIRA
jgi:hypothetical protein